MVNNQLSINHQVADYTIVSRKKNYTLSQESIAGNTHLIRTKVQPGNANQPRRANFREITIPAGFYLMMGDNRDNSADSRSIGLVPREEIIGRSNKVVFSLNYEQYLVPRSERFLKAI